MQGSDRKKISGIKLKLSKHRSCPCNLVFVTAALSTASLGSRRPVTAMTKENIVRTETICKSQEETAQHLLNKCRKTEWRIN